jgi:hypothetical protein
VEAVFILDGTEGGNHSPCIYHIVFEQVWNTSQESNLDVLEKRRPSGQ